MLGDAACGGSLAGKRLRHVGSGNSGLQKRFSQQRLERKEQADWLSPRQKDCLQKQRLCKWQPWQQHLEFQDSWHWCQARLDR